MHKADNDHFKHKLYDWKKPCICIDIFSLTKYSHNKGCTDPILRLDICPNIDKIAGSGIGKINRSTGLSFFFLDRSTSYFICQQHVCRMLEELYDVVSSLSVIGVIVLSHIYYYFSTPKDPSIFGLHRQQNVKMFI